MPETPRGPGGRWRPAMVALVALGGFGLLAPLVVNDRPLVAWGDGRIAFPALGGPVLPEGGSLPAPWPRSDHGIDLRNTLRGPSRDHPFGTDALGRDLLARVVRGGRISLFVAFAATGLALGAGALLGGAATLSGGAADLLLVRVVEVLGSFPAFIMALALVAVTGGAGTWPLIVAIGLGRSAASARFVRGEVMRWRGAPFWSAARAAGAGLPRLALAHLLPVSAGPLAVHATFGLAQAILLESTLSFLGVGLQPPTPSWGLILADGRATLEAAWWPVVFPAAALALTLALLGWAGDRAAD